MSALNNRRESEEGRTKLGKDLSSSKTQHRNPGRKRQSGLLVMQGGPGETGREPGDEAGGECAALETGFDVCREGWVSFSHPTNQKKKKMLQEQHETF